MIEAGPPVPYAAGDCADASYAYKLYGASPQQQLCTSHDSIAGPRTACGDENFRALFDTILKNREAADLGLGSAHKVERLDVRPDAGAAVPFERIAVTQYSGMAEAGNTVARTQAEFDALWRKLHGAAYLDNIGQLPRPADIPPAPPIDFGRRPRVGSRHTAQQAVRAGDALGRIGGVHHA